MYGYVGVSKAPFSAAFRTVSSVVLPQTPIHDHTTDTPEKRSGNPETMGETRRNSIQHRALL